MHVVIYSDDRDGFMDKFNKLNRRALKLGQNLMTITSVEQFEDFDFRSGCDVQFTQYNIDGLVPRLDGWTLIAKIEHTEDGNFIRSYNGEDNTHLADAKPVCEHCGQKRHRNTTYIVSHTSGDVKQVGSTCVADYTRSGILIYASRADDLLGYVDGLFGAVRNIHISAIMATAAAFIERDGFAKSSEADPTWRIVKDSLTKKPVKGESEDIEVTEAHVALAKEVIAWARKGGTNDYLHNLSVAAAQDWPDTKRLPILVSAVPSYLRTLNAAPKNDTFVASEWVGSVKDKIVETVTINRINSFPTDYGRMDIVTMVNGNNVFVWKTTSSPDWVEQGAEVVIRGTVKAHDMYRNIKQTVLSHVKAV